MAATGPDWRQVDAGAAAVGVAERDALGTTARVVVWPPHWTGRVLAAVDAELALLDAQASRFRDDSEISLAQRWFSAAARPGDAPLRESCIVSEGLAEAIAVALAAAEWTGGLVDPTVGGAVCRLGYDRDFATLPQDPGDNPGAAEPRGNPGAAEPGGSPGAAEPAGNPGAAEPAGNPGAAEPGGNAGLADPGCVPGWRSVRLDGRRLRLAAGVRLDLGATAKGLGSDRAAWAAVDYVPGGGVLVSLGGDIAVAGEPPLGGWPVLVSDEPERHDGDPAVPGSRQARACQEPAQLVRLATGALATSSVRCRRWRRGGRTLHHIVDPRTGLPAAGPWRTATVAAANCAEANAAATAAIVAGEHAAGWLTAERLPARLVAHDGSVCLLGGWPAAPGGLVEVPTAPRMPAAPSGMREATGPPENLGGPLWPHRWR